MVNIQKSGDSAIKFTFTDNDRYLYDGEITVPLNSLILVLDESDMVVIKKVDGDVFLTFLIDNTNFSTKAELEEWFKENACGSTGGSGSGVTEEWVEEYVSESISGKADTSDVQEIASDVTTVSGDVNTLSGSVNALTGAVNTLSGDVSALSGQVQSNETTLTAHTANTDIHVTASDKQNWNNKSDFSGDYNDLTNKPTIPTVPTNVSDFVNDAGYATSGYVDSSVSGKVNTTDFNTYSANTDARLSEDEEVTSAALNALDDNKQDTLVSGTNIKTINNESLLGSGNINIQGGGSNVIELTQAQYDALTDIDPDAFYIITDADGGATTGQVQTMINDSISGKADTSAVTEAVSGKMDTSSFSIYSASTDARLSEDEEVTAAGLNALNDALSGKQDTLSAGTNITISGNVISAEGGGKAIEAGRGISVTTGATADTVSFNLPVSAGTGENSLILGYDNTTEVWKSKATATGAIASGPGSSAMSKNSLAFGYQCKTQGVNGDGSIAQGYATTASGRRCHSEGLSTTASADASHSEGNHTTASGNYSHSEGEEVTATNVAEHSQGRYNISNKANNTWGDSGNTLFSVGNGTADNARHNAFEIRQNGDIYLNDGTNDVRLQDTILALGGLKLVSLTQAQYDALATKDASTLYIITGSN